MKFLYQFFTALTWIIPIVIGLFFFWITSGQASDKQFFGSMALATVGIPILGVLWLIFLFIQGIISKEYKKEQLGSNEKKAKVEKKKAKDRFERDNDF